MYELGTHLDAAGVAAGTNLLVTGPPLTGKRQLAMQCLAAGSNDGDGAIIVSTRDSAARVLADYETLLAAPDEALVGVVDAVTRHMGQSVEDTDRVKYTSSPTDTSALGIKFSEFIESYYAERGVEKNRVLLDSLTTLLLYTNLQTVFRFVHLFTSRIENADALGVCTMESTAHDDETTSTLRQLFDGVVEVDHDGTVTLTLPDGDPTRIER